MAQASPKAVRHQELLSGPTTYDLPTIPNEEPLFSSQTTNNLKNSSLLSIRLLNPSVILEISNNLNIEQLITTKYGYPRDYRDLAELLGYSYVEIENLKKCPNPTKSIFDSYMLRRGQLSVIDLIKLLERIERFDIADDLADRLQQLASRQSPSNNRKKTDSGSAIAQDDQSQYYKSTLTSSGTELTYLNSDDAIFNSNNDIQRGLKRTPSYDYDAFVCYADDDYEFVSHLIEYLEQQDVRIATREHLLPGHLEFDALTQLIDRRCRRMLIILSPQLLHSSQCDILVKFAASIGYEQQILKLIPVIYQHCDELPAIIRQLSKVDLSKSRGYEWALRKLVVSLKSSDNNQYSTSSNSQPTRNLAMLGDRQNEVHRDVGGERAPIATHESKPGVPPRDHIPAGGVQVYTKQPNGFESVVLMPGNSVSPKGAPSKQSLARRLRYMDFYKTPPFFMTIISLVQLGIFIRYGFLADEPLSFTGPVPFRSALIYSPYRRYEFWRYITYMFIHAGIIHIFFNIVVQLCIGVPLEMVHGFKRIFLVYLAGVLGGALGNSITDPGSFLAGASGGCHALIAAHLSNVILNWSEMDYRWFRLISLLTFASTDTGAAIYERYFKPGQTDYRTSYSGHLAGALSGLLLGLVCLRNLRVHRWEKILRYMASMIFLFLLAFAILYNILFSDHFPLPDYREMVWSASPFL